MTTAQRVAYQDALSGLLRSLRGHPELGAIADWLDANLIAFGCHPVAEEPTRKGMDPRTLDAVRDVELALRRLTDNLRVAHGPRNGV